MEEIKIPQSFWRDDLDDREVMVSIRCITYNHEPYIREALEGFVNQKTNFRFEAIVHDDASTDGTAAIIREYAEKYPSIIKPIFETENQYSKRDGTLRRIMDAHMRGKYIAICEGDDYWIDPRKLQKQVDFLEKNPQYYLCYTKSAVEEDGKIKKEIGEKGSEIEDLIIFNPIPTLTVLCRNIDKTQFYTEILLGKNWLMGDYPLWLWLATKGPIKFINETTSVYRKLSESASHSKSYSKYLKFSLNSLEISNFFVEKYNLENSEKLKQNLLWINLLIAIENENVNRLKTLTQNSSFPNLSVSKKFLCRSCCGGKFMIYIINRLLRFRYRLNT